MMTARPDLHLHSSASDGALAPLALVERAARAGVTLMALTDHDTLAGVDSLRGKETPIPVWAGVELSLKGMRSLHLLGYGRAPGEELRQTLNRLRQQRQTRGKAILERLSALGMPLADVPHEGVLGRAHIARAMVAAGYAPDVPAAFDRYIGEEGPAYVPGERLSMEEALALLRRSGMVPVLAHPTLLELEDTALTALIRVWKDQGLMGVEVYHPSRRGRGYAALDRLVRRTGLLVTGGSDYHTEEDQHGLPGCTLPDWPHAQADARALMAAMDQA